MRRGASPLRRLAVAPVLLLAACNPYGDGLGAILTGTGIADREPEYDVPFVPTPESVVAAMLDMAGVGAGDVLLDLGSGDGRIAIAAAKRGAAATGIEIDAALVERARRAAQLEDLADRARFRHENLFDTPLRPASVVTLYLLPRINLALRPRLLTELAPGTRVVAHAFDMGDWRPDAERLVGDRRVYQWTVPAVAGGSWEVAFADGRRAALELDQRFQDVSGTLDGVAATGMLAGRTLRLSVGGRGYTGEVVEDRIAGAGWTARRIG